MELKEIKGKVPAGISEAFAKEGIKELRPSQEKAIKKGLLDRKNMVVCTPTASGKTMIAEMAFAKAIMEQGEKAVYIVPLKALAAEKHKEFTQKYGKFFKIALSIGDLDSSDPYLADYDLIISTSEKMDSLLRHHSPWIQQIGCVIVDEIHLLNDPGRGPTLEVLITILRDILKEVQVIGLSATIGNPKDLAEWLNAELVEDDWRPVKLHKGVYLSGEVEFR